MDGDQAQRDSDEGDLIVEREIEANARAARGLQRAAFPSGRVDSWLDELRRRRAEIVRELVEVDRALVVAEKADAAEQEATDG